MSEFRVGDRVGFENETGVIVDINESLYKVRFNDMFLSEFWMDESQLTLLDKDTPDVSEGGSLRFNKGKPQFSHLSPHFIQEMMKVMTAANKKYPYLNYTKRQDVRTASDSLMRHFLSFQQGEDLDNESLCHHLAHVATNAMIIFQNLKDFGDEVDNRYEVELKKVQEEK